MSYLKTKAVVACTLVLSACSGGGSVGVVGYNTSNDAVEYDALQAAGFEIYTENYGSTATFVNKLPTGQHTYSGIAAFTTQSLTDKEITNTILDTGTVDVNPEYMSGSDPEYTSTSSPVTPLTPEPTTLGAMHLSMDFENDIVSGKIVNLKTETYDIFGQVDITNGEINLNQVNATFVGDLNENGRRKVMAGELTGVFVGENGGGFYGDLTQADNSGSTMDGFFFTNKN